MAISFAGGAADNIHEDTYRLAKEHVPDYRYEELVGRGEYRARLSQDPNSFMQAVSFYSVKPAYPALMALLSFTGINLIDASVIISNAAYFGIGLILLAWILRYVAPMGPMILATGLSLIPPVMEVARYSTPDAMSALVLLLGLYLFVEHRRVIFASTIIVASITVRPDNILFVVPLFLYFSVFKHLDLRWAGAFLAAAVIVYLAETSIAGYPGWAAVFYHTFVERIYELSEFVLPISYFDLLLIYARQILPQLASEYVVLFCWLALVGLVHRFASGKSQDVYGHVTVVIIIYMAAHYLLLPTANGRMLVAAYLFVLLGFVGLASEKITERRSKSRQ